MSEQTKICTRCNVKKTLDKFGRQKTKGKIYIRPHCKTCDVKIAAAYRLTPAGIKSRYIEGQRRYKAVFSAYKEIKRRHSCVICAENDEVCLDFHHLDPRTKKGEITNKFLWASFTAFIKEICKCVCICANCHRKLHAGKIQLPKNTNPISTEWIEPIVKWARLNAGLPAHKK